jgi:hypothetical protein
MVDECWRNRKDFATEFLNFHGQACLSMIHRCTKHRCGSRRQAYLMPRDLDNASQCLFKDQVQALVGEKPDVGEVQWACRKWWRDGNRVIHAAEAPSLLKEVLTPTPVVVEGVSPQKRKEPAEDGRGASGAGA